LEQLSQLFIEAVTRCRLNLKTKLQKNTLVDNYIIHIIYLLPFHL